MKTLTFALLLFFSTASLYGQFTNPANRPADKRIFKRKPQTGMVMKGKSIWVSDSIYTREKREGTLELTEKWYVTSRNSVGNTVTDYSVTLSNEQWVYYYSDSMGYYNDTLFKDYLTKQYDTLDHAWHDQYYYKLTPERDMLEEMFLLWEPSEHKYIFGMKNLYEYNEENDLIHWHYFNYDTLDQEFTETKKTDYYYDETGLDTLTLTQAYNAGSGEWEFTDKKAGEFDMGGYIRNYFKYYSEDNGTSWIPVYRDHMHYIDDEKYDTLEHSLWEQSSQSWQKTDLYINTFDDEGRITEEIIKLYTQESGWLNQTRRLYVYEGDKQISSQTDIWNNQSQEWEMSDIFVWHYNEEELMDYNFFALVSDTNSMYLDTLWKNVFKYDENNLLKQVISYNSDIYAGRELDLTRIKDYYWSLFTPSGAPETQDNSLFVYPNPSEGLIHIDCLQTNHKKALIRVRDIHGRNVFSGILNERYNILDLTKEPAGLYFVTVFINNKHITEPVVIK